MGESYSVGRAMTSAALALGLWGHANDTVKCKDNELIMIDAPKSRPSLGSREFHTEYLCLSSSSLPPTFLLLVCAAGNAVKAPGFILGLDSTPPRAQLRTKPSIGLPAMSSPWIVLLTTQPLKALSGRSFLECSVPISLLHLSPTLSIILLSYSLFFPICYSTRFWGQSRVLEEGQPYLRVQELSQGRGSSKPWVRDSRQLLPLKTPNGCQGHQPRSCPGSQMATTGPWRHDDQGQPN